MKNCCATKLWLPEKVSSKTLQFQALVVVLEALEAREVVKRENSEHLALRKGGLPAGGMLFKKPLWQRVRGEVLLHFLAEIVYEAEHFNHFGSI
ncbi:hypothetical protein GCM10028895_47990 [Pontibacter rugosus]